MEERSKAELPPGPTAARRPPGRPRRGWALAALALLLAGAGFGAQHFLRADPQAGIRTVTVELGDVEKTVTAVGSLKPREYVDVGTQVSGRVERIPVQIGDRVKKGDLIAEIDPTVYRTTVRKDQANLDNLKAQRVQQEAELALARQQLARNGRMLKSLAVSQDTFDQSDAAVKVAEAKVAATDAQIKADEATLAGNLANLAFTKVYAPISGTVVSQTTLKGQTVNAVQSAPVIVQIANLDVMTVWAQVAEADVSKIAKGMPAYFTTLGMPDRRWTGTVEQVQPTPVTKNDVVLYNVLINVDNREGLLLPTMTVQVSFSLGEARGVPVVPVSLLRADRKAGNDVYRATVLADGVATERTVRTGVANRTSAQVVSGLAVGDQVVVTTPPATASAGRTNAPPSMGARL